jgi:hypothetical protein
MGTRGRLRVRRVDVQRVGVGRVPAGSAVGALERLSVGHDDVLEGGAGRTLICSPVGARERRAVELGDVQVCGEGRAPRGPEVGTRAGGMRVARRYGDEGGVERASRGAAMGARERRSVVARDTTRLAKHVRFHGGRRTPSVSPVVAR